MNYYEQEPWGENACTWQQAVIGWSLLQAQSPKKLKFKPDAFMSRRKRQKPMTQEEYNKELIKRLTR